MKLAVFFVVGVLLGTGRDAQPAEGCGDVRVTAKALADLRQRGWTSVSQEDVLSMWPRAVKVVELSESEIPRSVVGEPSFERKRYLQIWEHQGRVIANKCLCCDVLTFGAAKRESGDYRLTAIGLFQLEKSEKRAEEAAKLLIGAGLGAAAEASGSTVVVIQGRDNVKKTVRAKIDASTEASVDLEITKAGSEWVVHLSYACEESAGAAR